MPYSYGSNSCLQHDFLHDPKCSLDNNGIAGVVDGSGFQSYCLRPWCFVDSETCMKSSERLFRSTHFLGHEGVDLDLVRTRSVSFLGYG